jgi:WD40 repeat protein
MGYATGAMTQPAPKVPERLSRVRTTRTLRLARVLGGDALSYKGGRVLLTRWRADGKSFFALVATLDYDRDPNGTLIEFDALTGQSLRSEPGIAMDTRVFSVSPDGASALLLDSTRATLVSLRERRRSQLPVATDPEENTRAAGFSSDGSLLLYATHPDAVFVARPDAEGRWSATRVEGAKLPVDLSPDSTRYAYRTTNQRLVIARASDDTVEETHALDDDSLALVRFSPSGASLVAAHKQGRIVRFDRGSPKPRWRVSQQRSVRALGIDDEASRVWVSIDSSRELVIDASQGKVLEERRLKIDPDKRAPDLYSPDGRRAISVWDRTLELIDCRTGEKADLHDGHSGAITSIVVAPDSSQFATTSGDGTVRTWRAQDGALLWVFGEPDSMRPITTVRYSQDGRDLFTVGAYNDLRQWDPIAGVEHPTGEKTYAQARLPGYDYPHTFALSWFDLVAGTDHAILSGPASSSDYSSPNATWRILRWNAAAHRVEWMHTDKLSRGSQLCLSPDGRVVVQRLASGALRMLRTHDGSVIDNPFPAVAKATTVAFAPSGALVVCALDGVWVFDETLNGERRSTQRYLGPIAINPSSDMMACVDDGGRVQLVSLANGAALDEIAMDQAEDACTALAFVDGGHKLAIGTQRHLVLLYERSA